MTEDELRALDQAVAKPFPPLRVDSEGRIIPMGDEELAARQDAVVRVLDAISASGKEDPPEPDVLESVPGWAGVAARLIRELTEARADIARLRSVVNAVCGPPLTAEEAEAALSGVELTDEDREAMDGIDIDAIIAYATDPANMSADEALRRMIVAARATPGFDPQTLRDAEACHDKRWRH